VQTGGSSFAVEAVRWMQPQRNRRATGVSSTAGPALLHSSCQTVCGAPFNAGGHGGQLLQSRGARQGGRARCAALALHHSRLAWQHSRLAVQHTSSHPALTLCRSHSQPDAAAACARWSSRTKLTCRHHWSHASQACSGRPCQLARLGPCWARWALWSCRTTWCASWTFLLLSFLKDQRNNAAACRILSPLAMPYNLVRLAAAFVVTKPQ